MTKPIPAIRPSMRSAWRTCPRKVFFGWVAGIAPARGRKPLIVGSSYHAGLEAWRRQGPKRDLKKAAQAAEREFVKRVYDERLSIDERDAAVTAAQIGAYVTGYAAAFPATFEKELVEVQVFQDGDGESGTADSVVQMESGEVWVVEDKTIGKFPPEEAMAMALRFNDQVSTYVHQLRARGIPAMGALYRQVEKTATTQTQKETLADYKVRLAGIYGPGSEKFREFKVVWSDAEMDRAVRERDRQNMEIIVWLDRYNLDEWPVNSSSCIGPYGPCEFLSLCSKQAGACKNFKPTEQESLDDDRYRKVNGISSEARPSPKGGASQGGDTASAPAPGGFDERSQTFLPGGSDPGSP